MAMAHIMVRTELDALPMEEKTGLAYASHDKTVWQGRETFVAQLRPRHSMAVGGNGQDAGWPKGQWHGTLMFIAQPAEEVGAAPWRC